jgi:NhaA family Na+:H+ antiporter
MAILLASLTAGTIGFLWLKLLGKPEAGDVDMDTLDFVSPEPSLTGKG